MQMKYIVIAVDNERTDVQGTRSIPIVFPGCLNHSDVFSHISSCINMHMLNNDSPLHNPKILSAGFVTFSDTGVYCDGKSQSLGGIESREELDAELIKNYQTHHEGVKETEYY